MPISKYCLVYKALISNLAKPIVCQWSEWETSACSSLCGEGTRTRTRYKTVEESNGGICDGKSNEIKLCNREQCDGGLETVLFLSWCIAVLILLPLTRLKQKLHTYIHTYIYKHLGFCPPSHPFPFCNGSFCCPTPKDEYSGELTHSDCFGCENGAETQCTASTCSKYGKLELYGRPI